MALNLTKTVVEFLRKHAEQKFTVRQIAELIFKTHSNECQCKKNNSKNIKSDGELIQQLLTEIGSQRPDIQKIYSQVKTTEGNPRKYYWNEKSDQAEIQDAEYIDSASIPLLAGDTAPKEVNLYPILSTFLRSELHVNSMRIDERKSSNKKGPQGNKWLYPDVVGMENLTADWHQEVKNLVKEYPDRKAKLWSFEVKLLLNRSNVREAFFQAVSNSSWANYGYLEAVMDQGEVGGSSEHEDDEGDQVQAGYGSGQALVVAGQPAAARHPGEAPFHHP